MDKMKKFSKKEFLAVGVKSFSEEYFYQNHLAVYSLILIFTFFLLSLFFSTYTTLFLMFFIISISLLALYLILNNIYNDKWLNNKYENSEIFNNEVLDYLSYKNSQNKKISQKFHCWYLITKRSLTSRNTFQKFVFRILIYTVVLIFLLYGLSPIYNLIFNINTNFEELFSRVYLVFWLSLILSFFLACLAMIESYSNRFRYVFDNILYQKYIELIKNKNKLIEFKQIEKNYDENLKKVNKLLTDLVNLFTFKTFGDFLEVYYEQKAESRLKSLHTNDDLLRFIDITHEIETYLLYVKTTQISVDDEQTQLLKAYIYKIRELINFELEIRKETEKPKTKRNIFFLSLTSFVTPPLLTYLFTIIL